MNRLLPCLSLALSLVPTLPALAEDAPNKSLDETGLVAVSVSSDGKMLASGSITGLIRLWTVADGADGKCFFHRGGVSGLAFSPDGSLLASLGGDGAVRVWNIGEGKMLHRFAADDTFLCMTFLGDGKRLAAGRTTIVIWDLSTGKECKRLERVDQPELVALSASPDGNLIASAPDEGTVQLWDVDKGTAHDLEKGRGTTSLAFSPDNSSLATLTRSGKLQLFDVASGEEQKVFQLHVGEEYLSLAFSADGKVIAFGKETGFGRCDAATGTEEKKAWKGGFRDTITPVAFDAGSRSFAASTDPLPRLWDLASPTRQRRAAVVSLNSEDLQIMWEGMGAADELQGLEILEALKLAPADVTTFFKGRLKAVEPIPDVDKLISDLSNPSFEARQTATEQLEKLGDYAVPELLKVLDGKPSLEVQRRVDRLLRLVEDGLQEPEDRADLRAVMFLGLLKSAEARDVLESLAEGDPKATLTRAAKKALGKDGEGKG
jgi:WD40 repeat protein